MARGERHGMTGRTSLLSPPLQATAPSQQSCARLCGWCGGWRNSSEKQAELNRAMDCRPSFQPRLQSHDQPSSGGPSSSFLFPALAAGSVLAFAVRATPCFNGPPAAARFFNAGRSDFLSRRTHRLGSHKRRTERLSSATALSDNNGVRWGIVPREGFQQLSSLPRCALTRGAFVMFASGGGAVRSRGCLGTPKVPPCRYR